MRFFLLAIAPICILFFIPVSLLHANEKKETIIRGYPSDMADEILLELGQGANVQAFGEDFIISNSNKYISLSPENIENPQVLFDKILEKNFENTNPRQVIGGGFIAIKLDKFLGKKEANQIKLVHFLSAHLSSEDVNSQLFSIKALSSDYFSKPTVFSTESRQQILEAINKHPEIVDLIGSEIDYASNNVLLLLPKMGRHRESIQLLRNLRDMDPSKKLISSVALSKMNIQEEQDAIIDFFLATNNLEEKYKYAYALSLWGGRKAQEVLASALRTPGTVSPRNGRPPEMISLHIAIALMRTIKNDREELPTRGCFSWKEEDFVKIENWATKHLGTKWNTPRPAYQPVVKVPF